jgi:dTDP-4-dehydrorhamnose 3,5-epimerase-like enzyme|tara:strand:+ start:1001 stop:1414 length:414 start_codon:yes stop_codon:yes gene_type:complete
MNTTVEDSKIISLLRHSDNSGDLVSIESLKDIPINVSRIFYVFDSDGENRGNHAHIKTKQVLICINGSVVVTCSDGTNTISFNLDSKDKALFIPEMIWDSVSYTGKNTILLVLSDSQYDRDDYIEDFDIFKNIKSQL